MSLRLIKLRRFSLIAASNLVSYWQYFFEAIVWPTGSNSKYITLWQFHQTDSKTFFGCNLALVTESAGSFASSQVRLRLTLGPIFRHQSPNSPKKTSFSRRSSKERLRRCGPTCFFRTTNAVPKCRVSE